ncbi:MAG: MFS transporter, partial [Actinomycetota bacterium]|nr:MFS transporter [Actinomycetota bacterium]
MGRFGVKPMFVTGFLACAAGLFLTSDITVHSSYASSVLPGMIILCLGSGVSFPAAGNAALH